MIYLAKKWLPAEGLGQSVTKKGLAALPPNAMASDHTSEVRLSLGGVPLNSTLLSPSD